MFIKKPTSIFKRLFGQKLIYSQLKDRIRELEDELRSSHVEEKYKVMASMLDHAFNSITVHDSEGRFLYANKRTFELHGYTKEEFLALRLKEIDVPESASLIEERMDIIREKGESSFEVAHFRKDRSILPLEVFVTLVDWQGRPAFLSIATDITEIKQTETALREIESKYGTVIETTNTGFVELDMEGRVISANLNYARLTGHNSVEEILDRYVTEWTASYDIERNKEEIIKCKTSNSVKNFEIDYQIPDGTIVPIEINVSVAQLNDNGRIIALCRDITEQRKAKEALQEAEYFLQKSQSIAQIGSYSLNALSGDWISSNALDVIFGIDSSYMKNIDGWGSVIHPDYKEEMLHYFTHHVIAEHNRFDKEYKIIRIKDQQERWVHGMGELEYDEQGRVTKMIGTIQDITERKRALDEIRKAKEKAEESDHLKTSFLQNMSHEIRTPMNAINGFSGLLENDKLSVEKRKHFTSVIIHSSNQLLSIVNDILTISSIDTHQEKVNLTGVCVNHVIFDLYSIFKLRISKRNVAIVSHHPLNDKLSETYTDLTKLTQILTNLLNNAMKFTNEGSIEFGYQLKGPDFEFFVKDNGIGIKPEVQDKIFERFRQADTDINKKFGGTGLGLAISKALVELLGGKIWVVSEIGKGSTFYFTIPYKPVPVEKPMM